MAQQESQHFLVVTYPFQGHINPALHLAKRIAGVTGGPVTFSTTHAAHRRMSPSSFQTHDGLLSYLPFSDGCDDTGGFTGELSGYSKYMSQLKEIGSRTLSQVVSNLTAQGRPVTCIIYTLLVPWAAEVAREHGIPSTHYWIQPASVFAIYYYYFHGYDELVLSHRDEPLFPVKFPGLPPLLIQDIPSFLVISFDESDHFHCVFTAFHDLFSSLDKDKPIVLVNTADALEPNVFAAIKELDLVAVGPVMPLGSTSNGGGLFKPDEKEYLQWLDANPEGSVVYVSFGSLSRSERAQMEELRVGLEESGRPYLWVVRKDDRIEGVELENPGSNMKGMVVEWCDQVKVLSHPSVGCFVSHCGWNSVLESLASGVPMVGAPRMSDQKMNARLVEEEWGAGTRAGIDKDGVVKREELRRCLDLVLGEGERAVEIRRRANTWRNRIQDIVGQGGSSDRNLRAFPERVIRQ
ncbi:UDP-glycosyltransferase 75C1-like [Typha latifolia]|uniref:UDP-glycosyltransferase 75C1-like n=1 Tax=Typha latifolia TaxID=4733 RepID=UPI003C2F9244